jgi:DNA-binding XRE family transcriptional regulator
MRHRLIQRRLELAPPLSREQLAHRIGMHPKTLGRIERGETESPYTETRHRLARGLDWSVAEVNRALEDDGSDPIRRHAVPAHLTHFASLEQTAARMMSWAPLVVPALLQSPDYVAAVERTLGEGLTETELAERVAFRLSRQRVVFRETDPLMLRAVIDQSVLLRHPGGASEILADQLEHLRAMNERPNVEVKVAPLDGRVFAAPGAFHLLAGAVGDPYIACPVDLMGVQYLENPPSLVGAYAAFFTTLWEGSDELDQVELFARRR